jgi:hypothetical protein
MWAESTFDESSFEGVVMADEVNPFRKALDEGDTAFTPFGGKDKNLTKERQLRTVRDMNLVDPRVLERSPHVAELTVQDLEDLADEFSGVPSNNPRVAELSLDDIQELEAVFFEFKVAAGKELASLGGRGELAAVDVSCCCCTPCCCCAATDMSETA